MAPLLFFSPLKLTNFKDGSEPSNAMRMKVWNYSISKEHPNTPLVSYQTKWKNLVTFTDIWQKQDTKLKGHLTLFGRASQMLNAAFGD